MEREKEEGVRREGEKERKRQKAHDYKYHKVTQTVQSEICLQTRHDCRKDFPTMKKKNRAEAFPSVFIQTIFKRGQIIVGIIFYSLDHIKKFHVPIKERQNPKVLTILKDCGQF